MATMGRMASGIRESRLSSKHTCSLLLRLKGRLRIMRSIRERAMRRRSLLETLEARFSEAQLRAIATRSVEIEDQARDAHGEGERAYAVMAEGWAKLCAERGITEAERDLIEDLSIQRGWLGAQGD